ncbi:MAG: DUF1707 domain-containing protein [Nostocoides sp.]
MIDKKGARRVSEGDRRHALTRLQTLNAQGVIRGQQELEERTELARRAVTVADLDQAFAGISKTGAQDFTLASDEDRNKAIRAVHLSLSQGHLRTSEAEELVRIIHEVRTREGIRLVLNDLPILGKTPTSTYLTNDARARAQIQLDRYYREGRLTQVEYTVKRAQVEDARTRQELDEAFTGLPGKVVENLSGVMTRVRVALLRAMISAMIALAGIYLLVIGEWKPGVGVLFVSVLALIYSATALIRPKKGK